MKVKQKSKCLSYKQKCHFVIKHRSSAFLFGNYFVPVIKLIEIIVDHILILWHNLRQFSLDYHAILYLHHEPIILGRCLGRSLSHLTKPQLQLTQYSHNDFDGQYQHDHQLAKV